MDARFEKLLLAYLHAGTTPGAREGLEAELWREFGQTKSVLVMDMAGFSLLTRRHGIVHYLSLVKRMQLATRPIVESHGGAVVKFEADNCFAAFDTALSAARAALELSGTFDGMNDGIDPRFHIRVSIGIDHGHVLMIGGPDYFGDPVNRASKLGEDVAGPGQILMTRSAFDLIAPVEGLQGAPVQLSISGLTIDAVELDRGVAG